MMTCDKSTLASSHVIELRLRKFSGTVPNVSQNDIIMLFYGSWPMVQY